MPKTEAESVPHKGQSGERFVFAVIILLSLGFGAASVVSIHRQDQAAEVARQSQILEVTTAAVIGANPSFQGDFNSPYTLVEFGDYQCPPCRSMHRRLPEFLKRYRGKMRFTFRNFPLTSIHPYALPAAIAAEMAREQGHFWAVHTSLFETELNAKAIKRVTQIQETGHLHPKYLTSNSARRVVQNDIRQAKNLGLESTPSFIICCPDGRVIRLQSLEELSNYMLM